MFIAAPKKLQIVKKMTQTQQEVLEYNHLQTRITTPEPFLNPGILD